MVRENAGVAMLVWSRPFNVSANDALAGAMNDKSAAMTTSWLVVAVGPPLRLMVWPVNTRVVDVPAELVSVTRAVKLPEDA